jgi:hypothetical protein
MTQRAMTKASIGFWSYQGITEAAPLDLWNAGERTATLNGLGSASS